MNPFSNKSELPTATDVLPGRAEEMPLAGVHTVLGHPLRPPFPAGSQRAIFAMGCFWGAERVFWQLPGVYTTAAGYSGGITPNPSYREVCSGRTGHAEAVLVVYDPDQISYAQLLRIFWESHDPTQGMRQGNDVGTQYRSAIFCLSEAQLSEAQESRRSYQEALATAGLGQITSEIAMDGAFYYAEEDHQQYLDKNPGGYCGLGGTGVACQIGLVPAS
jgi:peptide-methionine (S)-S-oxide reductase